MQLNTRHVLLRVFVLQTVQLCSLHQGPYQSRGTQPHHYHEGKKKETYLKPSRRHTYQETSRKFATHQNLQCTKTKKENPETSLRCMLLWCLNHFDVPSMKARKGESTTYYHLQVASDEEKSKRTLKSHTIVLSKSSVNK